MMMMFRLNFSAMLICCCCVMHVKGDDVCQKKFIKRINLSIELQSEILLPCYFGPPFNASIQNENTSVVWTWINGTVTNIVEIKVALGTPVFWDYGGRRIKAFSYISGSGNFSILIQKVQKTDMGLYCCELYRDDSCSLGYNEINISLAAVELSLLNNWLLMLGGGGFLLLCLITACGFYIWTKRQTVSSSHNCHESDEQTVEEADEITYTSVVHRSHSHNSNALVGDGNSSTPASDLLNLETVIYAIVKERGDKI